ncbi:DUF5895 domain-containing protein (plasmid) [Kovacikia minuta CCNUW1]|uniref:DUF5895 domain-containing protein n=1 Tax=Kovacikia minuta TaxID=2931930 RepID=UPI001CCBD84F|nr:DUF5895 domain-containing protein [Kovacikia minuta]UBF29933.1 DUF5895 domain-containing protein [Kovacikia minuta CCNUW1]
MPRKSEPTQTIEASQTTETTEQTQATDLQAIESANSADQPGALSLDFMDLEGEQYSSDDQTLQFRLPLALILNTKDVPKHGLFLKEESLRTAGWRGIPPNHVNTFSDKSQSSGVLLHGFHGEADGEKVDYRTRYPAPRMQILAVSPIFIKLTKRDGRDPFNPHTGQPFTDSQGNPLKAGAIIGTYEIGGSNPVYDALKLEKMVTLTTLYYFNLLDENNQKLHDWSFFLPISGAAAVSLSKAYTTWKLNFQMAYIKFWQQQGKQKLFDQKRNQKFYATGVFVPTLGVELSGQEQTSNTTSIVSVEVPTGENFLSYYIPKSQDDLMEISAQVDMSQGFAETYFKEQSEFHQYDPNVLDATAELLSLPSSTDPNEIPF